MGLRAKAELIGLPEKPVDLNMNVGIIIITKKIHTFVFILNKGKAKNTIKR